MPTRIPTAPARRLPARIPTGIGTWCCVESRAAAYAPMLMKPALPSESCPVERVMKMLTPRMALMSMNDATCRWYGFSHSIDLATGLGVRLPEEPLRLDEEDDDDRHEGDRVPVSGGPVGDHERLGEPQDQASGHGAVDAPHAAEDDDRQSLESHGESDLVVDVVERHPHQIGLSMGLKGLAI